MQKELEYKKSFCIRVKGMLDQLSAEAGIARRSLVRYMNVLKESGRIERVGGKRYGHWDILE